MEQLAQSDVFFFITSVAVIFVVVALVVILAYVIVIMRDIKRITGMARKGSYFLEGRALSLWERLRKDRSLRRKAVGFFMWGAHELKGLYESRKGNKDSKSSSTKKKTTRKKK